MNAFDPAGAYPGEPCRVCGKPVGPHELPRLVWAGLSRCHATAVAHGSCWDARPERSRWAYPDDVAAAAGEGGQ